MDIIGHQKILELLNKSIVRGTIAQAYLFSGPEHLGKFTVALDFAQRLSGSSLEINPDLIVIRPEIEEKKGIVRKLDIKVEKVRDLEHQLGLTATGGKYKVAVIDDADRLNITAQNALLKTLEEPNEKVILILVAKDERKLLPTILSRCQKIKFGPVSQAELEKRIEEGEKEKAAILFWSLGRPGLMLEFLRDREELIFRENSLKELQQIFERRAEEKLALAESLSKDTRLAAKKLNLWLVILRENFLGRKAGAVGQVQAFRLAGEISRSLESLRDTNASARLTLENLLLQF